MAKLPPMPITGAIIKGLMFGLLLAISVGPTIFAIIRYSLNHSYKAGIAFVLGVSISDIMYVLLANLSAPFMEELKLYETQIAYGGGALLFGWGALGLLKKYKPKRPSSKIVTLSNSHYFRIWGSGFLINTINPGVIIQWLGSVVYLTSIHADTRYRIVFFGVCLGVVLGFDFLKVLLADTIRKKLTLRLVMYLQKLSSAILLVFGLVILAITYFKISLPGFG